MAVFRLVAFTPARLDKSFASSLRLHAALGISTLAHAAILFNGSAPHSDWSHTSAASSELAVSLAVSEPSLALASSSRHALTARHRSPAAAALPTTVPRPAEATQAFTEDPAGGEARDALAPGAATQLASAAPAAGLVDLLDTTHARFAPSPIYPEEARWEGREGRVLLRFRLRADGRVAEAVVLGSSGHADLDAAALATIRHWSFGTPGGTAAEVWYRHTFRFALR